MKKFQIENLALFCKFLIVERVQSLGLLKVIEFAGKYQITFQSRNESPLVRNQVVSVSLAISSYLSQAISSSSNLNIKLSAIVERSRL